MGGNKAAIVIQIVNNTNSQRQLGNEMIGNWQHRREMVTTIIGNKKEVSYTHFSS